MWIRSNDCYLCSGGVHGWYGHPLPGSERVQPSVIDALDSLAFGQTSVGARALQINCARRQNFGVICDVYWDICALSENKGLQF